MKKVARTGSNSKPRETPPVSVETELSQIWDAEKDFFRNITDADHWTENVTPANDTVAADVYANYDPHVMAGEDPRAAAIILADFYEAWRDKGFEDAAANFSGLYQLIKHNPHFRPEAEAMRRIIQGEHILNQFCRKVRAL